MQARSRPARVSLPMLFVLLTGGSAVAGALLPNVRSASGPPPVRAEQKLEASPLLGFPSAATFQERFLAGALDGAHPLTAGQLDELQAALDELNRRWHETTVLLHDRMEVVVDEWIASGELKPVSNARSAPRGDAIGGRLAVHDGVAFEKFFYAGDDARVDSIQRRRALLTHFADVVVRRAFH